MSSLPPIFFDLAIILMTAGIITVIFKWLKQPLVLGYIVAGFFIGPYFPWFPAITDDTNIHVWSEIGIVFLMFALGLEFSVKKLKKVGATGAITALTELAVMFVVGFVLGLLLRFSAMESVFLGCMLSISSTTIIIKSFDDLKLKQQKFTGTVTAVLVVEDLIAVLLLVLLSTISVKNGFDGGVLLMSLLKLLFSIIVWFVFGIFLIPTLLKKMRKFMTEETLCVVAVGLCFGMVVMADSMGFSTALGAFIMGAILSETIEADAIHRVVTPIKNLFGAVFFVSVGMLVNPQVLVSHLMPILTIAATVIVFKSLAATTGVVLSGKPLRSAMQSGFCFCQIGEFSFIIAGLGLARGVTDPSLYPMIVTVSILTTFATPYMIKAGIPAYEWLEPRLPKQIKEAIEKYTDDSKDEDHKQEVQQFVKKQLASILLYSTLLLALMLISFSLLQPMITNLCESWRIPIFWGNLLGALITLTAMSPFLWAVTIKNVSISRIREMLDTYRFSQVAVIPIILLRYFLALFFVGTVVGRYVHIAVGLIIVIAIAVVAGVILSHRATNFYNHLEKRFFNNFNKRQNQTSFRIPESLEENFHMERLLLSAYSTYAGQKLMDTDFRKGLGVNIVSIERAGKVMDLPAKETILLPLDRLTVIGGEEQLAKARGLIEVEPDMLVHDHTDNEMNMYRLEVKSDTELLGLDIVRSQFQIKYNAMIIAIERGGEFMINPASDTHFEVGDVVWFVSPEMLSVNNFQTNTKDNNNDGNDNDGAD